MILAIISIVVLLVSTIVVYILNNKLEKVQTQKRLEFISKCTLDERQLIENYLKAIKVSSSELWHKSNKKSKN